MKDSSNLRFATVLMLAALGLPGEASAAEGFESAEPDTWQLTQAQLEELGLGQSRGEAIPVPIDADRLRDPNEPRPLGGASAVIFVNFDGETLSSGSDDSKANRTQIGNLAGVFAAYGEGAKRDAVMQAVRDDWADFNVTIVETRPASGDYAMCMTGPTNPFGGGVLGIAPLDCNDSQTPNNIVYAFHSVNDNHSASTTATTIGQEVAHSYGLEHVNEPGDIMNPFNAGGDPVFNDQCITVDPGQNGILCGNQHTAECGSSNQQNSYQELLTLFGPSTPDAAAPTVSITAPTDGTEFSVGDSFEITVDANDDVGIDEVTLYTDGVAEQTDNSSPYGWSVANIPEGTYEFYVEARDIAGNTSMSNVITVYVGTEAPADGGVGDEGGGDEGGGDDGGGDDGGITDGGDGGGSAGDEGGGSGSAGDGGGSDDDDDSGSGDVDDDGEDEDGALPSSFGMDGEPASCACTTDGGEREGGIFGLSLLGLLGLLRRRRR